LTGTHPPHTTLFPYTTLFRSRALRLAAGLLERRREFVRPLDDAHPPPAAAVGRLEDHRVTQLRGRRVPVGRGGQRPRAPPQHRQDRKSTRLNSSHGSTSYAVF